MKKKVFPLIISLVMVLALGPMSVFADNDEELNSGEIVNKYEIKLLDKSLTYGDAFGGGVIDVNNVKLNGNIVDPKESPVILQIGQAINIVCTNADDGKVYETKDGAIIPIGEYIISGEPRYPFTPGDTNVYEVVNTAKVTVSARTLTEDDVEKVTIEEGEDSTKIITVEFKREKPQEGYMGGIQNTGFDPETGTLKYDDVKAVAMFKASEVNKDGTYSITEKHLIGDEDLVGNYVLQNGGIVITADGKIVTDTDSEVITNNTDKDSAVDTADNTSLLWVFVIMLFTFAAISVACFAGRKSA